RNPDLQSPEQTRRVWATYQGVECECTRISATGARILFPHSQIFAEPRGRFRIDLGSSGIAEADASWRSSVDDGNSADLEFHWSEYPSMRAFSTAIYSETSDDHRTVKK